MARNQIIKSVIAGIAILGFLLWAWPTYCVWSAGMTGKAAYRKATYNRRVKVLEAQADADAAAWYQKRDTTNAHAVARSNAIIGNSLINNQPYLVFKWLETLRELKGNGQVIYLPGLAPLPVTEATRLQQPIQLTQPTE